VDHRVSIRLIGHLVGFRSAEEMLRALRHRYVMVYYAIFSVILCLGLHGLSLVDAPINLVVSSIVLGLVALQLVVMAYLRVWTELMRWSGRGGAVWLTPALVVGTVAMKWVVVQSQAVFGLEQNWSDGWGLMIWLGVFVLVEALATAICHGPLPRALAVLRASEDGLGANAAVVPEQSAELVIAEAGGAMPPPLEAGSVRVPVAQVQRLEANGNYVMVVTESGRHLMPGPFGDVAAVMPDRLGRRVHRSHWVSWGAARRLVRAGRDMWIVAAGDAVVPVASSMHEAVQDWLAGYGIRVERGQRPRVAKAAR